MSYGTLQILFHIWKTLLLCNVSSTHMNIFKIHFSVMIGKKIKTWMAHWKWGQGSFNIILLAKMSLCWKTTETNDWFFNICCFSRNSSFKKSITSMERQKMVLVNENIQKNFLLDAWIDLFQMSTNRCSAHAIWNSPSALPVTDMLGFLLMQVSTYMDCNCKVVFLLELVKRFKEYISKM